ncbi:MAG TPA: DNA topoisomerase, partial [Pyrinomonadaceae bacterium]|nr:DNA topoisomerase [Pyrinomonadaceae bacterium]
LGSRHVNDKKVSDHHAIIPTPHLTVESLTGDEQMVFELILERLLAAFYPVGKNQQTIVVIDYFHHLFATKGTIILEEGWRKIEKDEDENEKEGEDDTLPSVNKQTLLQSDSVDVLSKETRPPNHFNDASLLGAMETAGQIIEDDEDAREAMKENGLGMVSTRHEIINTLIKRGYLIRQKKQILSTTKAHETIRKLDEIGSILVSPILTGKWEGHLNKIARNEISPTKFQDTLPLLVGKIVTDISKLTGSFSAEAPPNLNGKKSVLKEEVICPKCRSLNRDGVGILKEIVGKDKLAYFICSFKKDDCGFISRIPKLKSTRQKLFENLCICGSYYVYKILASGQELLSCSNYPNCKNAVWIDKPLPKSSKQGKG